MLNFKRADPLLAGTTAAMNKGVLFANSGGTLAGVTCFCLNPTGGRENIRIIVPAADTLFFPVYTQGWTSASSAIQAFEVN